MEEEIGAGLVDRQIPKFIDHKDGWADELFEFRGQAVGD